MAAGDGTELVRVSGDCMSPRIKRGAWVQVDRGRSAQPGDIVVARWDQVLLIKELHEWLNQQWLVAIRGCEPVAVEAPIEILGVVTMVVQPR